MPNKNHTVTVRLNDLEYEYLQKLKEKRFEIEGQEYSYSDLMRIALGYMTDREIWESVEYKVIPEIRKKQMEYAKNYWKHIFEEPNTFNEVKK